MDDIFIKLINNCKASIHLTVDNHKDHYECIHEYIKTLEFCDDEFYDSFDKNVIDKCKELDTIIELTFYPHTPIGSIEFIHYDLELLIKEVEEYLNGC